MYFCSPRGDKKTLKQPVCGGYVVYSLSLRLHAFKVLSDNIHADSA